MIPQTDRHNRIMSFLIACCELFFLFAVFFLFCFPNKPLSQEAVQISNYLAYFLPYLFSYHFSYKTVPQETVLGFKIVMYDKQTAFIWCVASLKLNILFDVLLHWNWISYLIRFLDQLYFMCNEIIILFVQGWDFWINCLLCVMK